MVGYFVYKQFRSDTGCCTDQNEQCQTNKTKVFLIYFFSLQTGRMCNTNCDEKVLVLHQSYAEAGMESNVVTHSEEESSNQSAKLLLNTGIIIWFGFPSYLQRRPIGLGQTIISFITTAVNTDS